ncbi:hypothetical protein EDB89DRAFT_2118592 [Lactarius sanguifluus]|nr:hypothetical protein EDB89DRAFT_2118592 [Lactarius sanguifluus]
MIQKEIKNGSLSRKKGVNAYVLTINNFDGLILLTSLINGNMRTPKIHTDGHFSVRATSDSKYPRVECKFELSQRQNDHNEIIANFLLSSVKAIRVDKPKPEYRVRTTSLNGNLILENYLNTFPLFGILDKFKSGRFQHKSNIEEIILIKSYHLGKFYNLD